MNCPSDSINENTQTYIDNKFTTYEDWTKLQENPSFIFNKLTSQHVYVSGNLMLIIENGMKRCFESKKYLSNNVEREEWKEVEYTIFPIQRYYDYECDRTIYSYKIKDENETSIEFIHDMDKTRINDCGAIQRCMTRLKLN